MSKSVESTRRELFEAGINIRTRTRNEHGDYVLGEIRDMWSGFNLALDSIEIDLPSKYKTEEGYSMYDVAEVITCIHNTNLGLKIK